MFPVHIRSICIWKIIVTVGRVMSGNVVFALAWGHLNDVEVMEALCCNRLSPHV